MVSELREPNPADAPHPPLDQSTGLNPVTTGAALAPTTGNGYSPARSTPPRLPAEDASTPLLYGEAHRCSSRRTQSGAQTLDKPVQPPGCRDEALRCWSDRPRRQPSLASPRRPPEWFEPWPPPHRSSQSLAPLPAPRPHRGPRHWWCYTPSPRWKPVDRATKPPPPPQSSEFQGPNGCRRGRGPYRLNKCTAPGRDVPTPDEAP